MKGEILMNAQILSELGYIHKTAKDGINIYKTGKRNKT